MCVLVPCLEGLVKLSNTTSLILIYFAFRYRANMILTRYLQIFHENALRSTFNEYQSNIIIFFGNTKVYIFGITNNELFYFSIDLLLIKTVV